MMCSLENSYEMALNRLGEAIRQLIGKRDMSQADLASQIGLSESSLSQIINGVHKPRQKTFSRLLNRLCPTPEDRAFLLDAYLGIEDGAEKQDWQTNEAGPQAASSTTPTVEEDEAEDEPPAVDPAARFMEVKAASIAFQQDIEHLLHVAKIPYIHPFSSEKIGCDFVTKTKTKIVIECKVNLNAGWDRLLGQCIILRDNLPAKEVVVVVPYHNKISALYMEDFKRQKFHVETPSTLVARLKNLGV